METLNLANPSASTIKYDLIKFPDGQQDIVVNTKVVQVGDNKNIPIEFCSLVKIKSRFNSFQDLELILCATKALQRLGVKNICLYIPYLLGARSDREFKVGGTSYLVDIIAPILNAQNYKSVYCLDAHSDVAAACIRNYKNVYDKSTLKNFYKWAIDDIKSRENLYTLTSPDAGSLKKIYEVAKTIGYDSKIAICSKHRDIPTGKILETIVPLDDIKGSVVIVDDICDGGRTFIEIAKAIKSHKPFKDIKIYLIVTHGIFSSGLTVLLQHFEMIYTTDSIGFQSYPEEDIMQFKIF